MYVIRKSGIQKGLPKSTTSLCPECKKVIPAHIYEEDGKVWIKKRCPVHGEYKDIYYGDVDLFLRMEKYAVDGIGIENPQTSIKGSACPFICGLCDAHFTSTSLANVDLTNRCNLRCPICFANANSAGYVYEPTYEQVLGMLKLLRSERPVPTPAVQFSGGEPTIHPRFFDIVRAAKEMGFAQVQVATNGILLAKEGFCQKMADAGMDTVYLQFDGFKEETYIKARGANLLPVKMKAIENCRNTKPKPLATVLVPTIVRGVNDDEVGKIVNFALENIDVIRGVNFQPVSFAGRIEETERIEGRYTTADLIRALAEQTDFLEKEDFYPVPAGAILGELASQVLKDPKIAFTCHPHCGAATYVFKGSDGKAIPLPRFFDVEGFLDEVMDKVFRERYSRLPKVASVALLLRTAKKYYDRSRAPDNMPLLKMLKNIFYSGEKDALGELHWRSLFIGSMHFMDDYNYDIARVMRCAIHYATPDGRIIPFCAYNGGPTYREEVERKFSIPLEEYRRRHGNVEGV